MTAAQWLSIRQEHHHLAVDDGTTMTLQMALPPYLDTPTTPTSESRSDPLSRPGAGTVEHVLSAQYHMRPALSLSNLRAVAEWAAAESLTSHTVTSLASGSSFALPRYDVLVELEWEPPVVSRHVTNPACGSVDDDVAAGLSTSESCADAVGRHTVEVGRLFVNGDSVGVVSLAAAATHSPVGDALSWARGGSDGHGVRGGAGAADGSNADRIARGMKSGTEAEDSLCAAPPPRSIRSDPVPWLHQHALLFSPVRRITLDDGSVYNDVMGVTSGVAAVLALIPWPTSWRLNATSASPSCGRRRDGDVVPIVHRWRWSAVTQTLQVLVPETLPVTTFASMASSAATVSSQDMLVKYCNDDSDVLESESAHWQSGSADWESDVTGAGAGAGLQRLCRRWHQLAVYQGIVQRASDERTAVADETGACRRNLTRWLNDDDDDDDTGSDGNSDAVGDVLRSNVSATSRASGRNASNTTDGRVARELPADWQGIPRVFHVIAVSHNRSQDTPSRREAALVTALLQLHPVHDVVVWYATDLLGTAHHPPLLRIGPQLLHVSHDADFAFDVECECARAFVAAQRHREIQVRGDRTAARTPSESESESVAFKLPQRCASVEWRRYAVNVDRDTGEVDVAEHSCFHAATPSLFIDAMRTEILGKHGGVFVDSTVTVTAPLQGLACGAVPPFRTPTRRHARMTRTAPAIVVCSEDVNTHAYVSTAVVMSRPGASLWSKYSLAHTRRPWIVPPLTMARELHNAAWRDVWLMPPWTLYDSPFNFEPDSDSESPADSVTDSDSDAPSVPVPVNRAARERLEDRRIRVATGSGSTNGWHVPPSPVPVVAVVSRGVQLEGLDGCIDGSITADHPIDWNASDGNACDRSADDLARGASVLRCADSDSDSESDWEGSSTGTGSGLGQSPQMPSSGADSEPESCTPRAVLRVDSDTELLSGATRLYSWHLVACHGPSPGPSSVPSSSRSHSGLGHLTAAQVEPATRNTLASDRPHLGSPAASYAINDVPPDFVFGSVVPSFRCTDAACSVWRLSGDATATRRGSAPTALATWLHTHSWLFARIAEAKSKLHHSNLNPLPVAAESNRRTRRVHSSPLLPVRSDSPVSEPTASGNVDSNVLLVTRTRSHRATGSDTSSLTMPFTSLAGRWYTDVDAFHIIARFSESLHDDSLASCDPGPTRSQYVDSDSDSEESRVNRLRVEVAAGGSSLVDLRGCRPLDAIFLMPPASRTTCVKSQAPSSSAAPGSASASDPSDSEKQELPRAVLSSWHRSVVAWYSRANATVDASGSTRRGALPEFRVELPDFNLPVKSVRDCASLHQWWLSAQTASEGALVLSSRQLLRGKHLVMIGDSVRPT